MKQQTDFTTAALRNVISFGLRGIMGVPVIELLQASSRAGSEISATAPPESSISQIDFAPVLFNNRRTNG